MKNTTIRVDEGLLVEIRLLKEVKMSKTYCEVLHEVVKRELMETMANCGSYYGKVGTVVSGTDGEPLVITAVDKYKVTFSNGYFVMNGGKECRSLEWLADSVDEFDGGFIKQ